MFMLVPRLSTKGAERNAPPGTGSRPMMAGRIMISTFFEGISCSSAPTILSRMPYCLRIEPRMPISSTTISVCRDENVVNTRTSASSMFFGPRPPMTAMIRPVTARIGPSGAFLPVIFG